MLSYELTDRERKQFVASIGELVHAEVLPRRNASRTQRKRVAVVSHPVGPIPPDFNKMFIDCDGKDIIVDWDEGTLEFNDRWQIPDSMLGIIEKVRHELQQQILVDPDEN